MLQVVWLGALVVLVLLVVFVGRQARLVARSAIATHPRRTGRLVAVACIGMALGVGAYFTDARKRTGGKEAFMEAQAHRFDRFVSKPHDLVPEVLSGTVFAGSAVGAYELIAWALYLVIKPAKKEGAAADTLPPGITGR
jgi:hypothetical protein